MVLTAIIRDPRVPRAAESPFCAHPPAAQEAVFTARDYITGDRFTLERCRACGLVRTAPAPSGAAQSRYYPPGYYGHSKRYGVLIERLIDWLYAFRTRLIEITNGLEPGRVLDIGCGRGLLLHQLRRRGWDVAGTELSEDSARYAREVLHIDVKTGSAADLALPSDSFDTVILWHVLEHIAEPETLLQEAARILRPGGTLLVAVPNFGSLEARWARAHWFHLDVPRHLIHFTPRTLRAMLETAGLRPRLVSYFASEYDFFSFVQTVLNKLGVRHNLLYNLLRTRGAKVLSDERAQAVPTRDLVLTFLLAPILGLASLAWVPAAALLGQGATITIYAKKPRA